MRPGRAAGLGLALAVGLGLAGVAWRERGIAWEADGQAVRGVRLAAFVRTGDPDFLQRWGEPVADGAAVPPAGLRAPYPPVGAALGALAPAVLGSGPGAARVGAALGVLALLAAAARAGGRAGGAWGAWIAAGLVAASPVVQAAGRLPVGETWAAAAALWALPAVAAPAAGARAGLQAGLAFLVKWSVAPALVPALVGRLARARPRDGAAAAGLLVGGTAAAFLAASGRGASPAWLVSAGAFAALVWGRGGASAWPVTRGVAATLSLGLPWVAWAGGALGAHVAGHAAEASPVGLAAGARAAWGVLPVLLPGGAAAVFGALGAARRPLVGAAWAGGALSLAVAVGAGRPWALGLGDAQDRLLVAPAALFAVAAAGWGASRAGPALGAGAAALGVVLSLLPLAPGGPPGPPVGASRLVAVRVCGGVADPRPFAYRWVPPGLAVAPGPRLGAAPPRLAVAAAALPVLARPRIAALVVGPEDCPPEESDLIAFAARGRVVAVAPRGAPEALHAWLTARRPAVQEVVGVGDAGVRAVARLVADGGWSFSTRAPGVAAAFPSPLRHR